MTSGANYPSAFWRATMLAAFCMSSMLGCDENAGDSAPEDDAPKPAIQQIDRGPIKLTVTADRDRISIAERLKLRIEVEAAAGIDVTMPPFGAVQSEFQLRDQHEEPVQILADDIHRYVQVYDLDSNLSGTYTIAAVTVGYVDRREAATEDSPETTSTDKLPRAELTTEPFTIEVTSLLEGEFDPADFRDVKDVVPLPVERSWGWLAWTAGGVGALILLVCLVVFVSRRYHGRVTPMIAIPPHEWAFAQLQELASAGLIEAGEFRPFYYRLSEITRTYIELRFGLMAPEQTTEEFLEEMQSSDVLDQAHQPSLREFLSGCDKVKYALYEPSTDEVEEVFNSARDFVESTRVRATVIPSEVAA